jgi:hypothetical protein
VTKQFDQLLAQDLPALNDSLKSKGQQPISPSPAKVGANSSTEGAIGATGLVPSDSRFLTSSEPLLLASPHLKTFEWFYGRLEVSLSCDNGAHACCRGCFSSHRSLSPRSAECRG